MEKMETKSPLEVSKSTLRAAGVNYRHEDGRHAREAEVALGDPLRHYRAFMSSDKGSQLAGRESHCQGLPPTFRSSEITTRNGITAANESISAKLLASINAK